MYLGNLNQFKCDYCGTIELVKTFPKGWFWVKHGLEGGVGHTCSKPECIAQVPTDKLMPPGKKN